MHLSEIAWTEAESASLLSWRATRQPAGHPARRV